MPRRSLWLIAVTLAAAPVAIFAQSASAVSYPSRHVTPGKWDLMYSAIAFAEFDSQGGSRGDRQFGSLNWGMLMASRDVAGGQLQLRTMLSLDALTVTKRGYPLLLQSGERLHDRQHPHDFWMELGAAYEHPVSSRVGVRVYAAASGEPALGPTSFTERPSAMDNPMAPLGHHWQDATHVSFGVATLGITSKMWKLEGSAFNGRDPDDQRFDFDFARLDSYSGRLTVAPNSHWSATAGYGFIREASESEHRIVASLAHGVAIGMNGQIASAAVFGANVRANGTSRSLLAESEWVINERNAVFARVESVQKSAEDLLLTVTPGGFPPPNTSYDIRSASLGYVREIVHVRAATIGIGASGSVNFVPVALKDVYGSRTPVGAMVFMRVRFVNDAMAGMPGM